MPRVLRLLCVACVSASFWLSVPLRAADPAPADAAPKLLKRVDPDYPRDLQRKGINGRVTVEIDVDGQGRVTDARVAESNNAAFDKPALDAVRRWKFSPGVRGGSAVPMTVRMSVAFGIDLFDDKLLDEHKTKAAAVAIDPPVPQGRYRGAYPYSAALAQTTGSAVVSFFVDENGYSSAVTVTQSTNLEFGAAAVAAVEAMRFTPAKQGGAAVGARTEYELHFGGEAGDVALDAATLALAAQLNSGEKLLGGRELDAPPKRLSGPAPRLPEALWQEGRGGSATIEFFVGADGRVLLCRSIKADDERLAWAAMTAIQQWKFEPPLKNGVPVVARLAVPVNFPAPVKATAAAK